MSFKARKAAAVLALLLLLNSASFAWGPEGHRIVAILAWERLTPAAKAQVKALLGKQKPPAVANYADQIRNSRPETKNWHFVDIPLNATNYDPARDCAESDKGDCVIAELARAKAAVVNTHLSKSQRAEALKFIVHFVGDLHQPLHCADNHDLGGNQVEVQWFGAPSNLHRVWDSGIIDETRLAEQDYADQLDSWLESQDETKIAKGTTTDWALEAHMQAHDHAYPGASNGGSLGASYFDANQPVVDEQLAKGGVRLAKFLNDIFPASHAATGAKKKN